MAKGVPYGRLGCLEGQRDRFLRGRTGGKGEGIRRSAGSGAHELTRRRLCPRSLTTSRPHDDHCARERETRQGCAPVVFRFLSAAAVCELPGRPAVAVAFRDALPTQKALQGGRPVTCTLMCVELVGFGLTIIGRRRRVGTDGWKSGEGG
jgi:hypothetical protein